MKKTILFFVLTISLSSVSGVSAQVADSVGIVRFWTEYYTSALENGDLSGYWQPSGYNLIQPLAEPRMYIEKFLPHKIERIDALNDSVSVITVSLASRPSLQWYKMAVVRRDGGYKLIDYFQSVKGGLFRGRTKYIDLYSLKRNVHNGRRMDRFIEELCSFYGFDPDRRIEYFSCSDIEECFHTAGIGFNRGWAFICAKGLTIGGTLVFTGKRFHPHELVHAVMRPKYPGASIMLSEGLAIYHSKAGRKKFVGWFRRYVAEGHENMPGEQSHAAKGAGYLLVDHVLKNYGKDKMLALLSCTDLDEALEKELGVPRGKSFEFLVSLMKE